MLRLFCTKAITAPKAVNRQWAVNISQTVTAGQKANEEIKFSSSEEFRQKRSKFNIKTDNVEGRPLYLDAQAITPSEPRVLDAMLPYLTNYYGNPHCRTHVYGWETEQAVGKSREQVANIIGAEPKEIIFTSGATESYNISVKCLARFYSSKKTHVITTQTENKCLLDSCCALEDEDFRVTYLPVKSNGIIDMQQLHEAITPDTSLVPIMTVNNEIGVKQSVKDIGDLCRSKKVFFHADTAQAVGKMPPDVNTMNIDLMCADVHVSDRNLFKVVDWFGLGAAAELSQNEMECDTKRINFLSKHLVHNGCMILSFAYVEGESLLIVLKDVAFLSHSSIRFGIGRFTTVQGVNYIAERFIKHVECLCEMSPLWVMVQEGIDLTSIQWSQH